MRSRAAILPFPGDPFLLNYWLHFFDTVWGDEVDKLYIVLNSPIEKAVVDYIQMLCDGRPKIKLLYVPNQIDHGPAILMGLEACEEKYVMLVEDDGFIFKPGMVNRCFEQLESGNYYIVGSKRGSCHMEILTAAQNKWGLAYEGEGDHGPNFWPNFFFTNKELLMATDQNFSAKAWHQGEIIKGLEHKVNNEVIYGDTFVNTSLQLRGMIPGNRILCVAQYHGHPDDMDHAQRNQYLFDGVAPWAHIGSLSSGVGGILRDGNNRALARRLIDPPQEKTVLERQWCQTEEEKKEFERRVQFWATFYENAIPTPGIAEFYDLYGKAVKQIIDQYQLKVKNIKNRQFVYKERLGI